MDEFEILLEKVKNQENEINNLKKEINRKDKIINNLPLLSNTYLGGTTLDGKITYRNWWPARIPEFDGFLEKQWFTEYLNYHFPDADYKINFFSVFGDVFRFDDVMEGKKVFFTPEELNHRRLFIKEKFGQNALDCVDFSMGFDVLDNPKYLRFPFWMHYIFRPDSTKESIKAAIEYFNTTRYDKTEDTTLICSHDNFGTRTLLTSSIEGIADIKYAGAWRNNTSDLWDKYGNHKIDYLTNFKFNICPENMESDAYVTEKIFDAVKGNCIPLYAGGGNYLEPLVLNKKAILFWDLSSRDEDIVKEDNADTIELFKTLHEDDKSYEDFKQQNLLLDDSYKYISKTFSDLKKHFERIIYD